MIFFIKKEVDLVSKQNQNENIKIKPQSFWFDLIQNDFGF